ncbi:MAG: AAA family ATPase [Azonexus sp.]|nr:AAA family ATPase [Azonexus sp.]MCK6411094.1 AAA family ATPase [Azonexus sp.]
MSDETQEEQVASAVPAPASQAAVTTGDGPVDTVADLLSATLASGRMPAPLYLAHFGLHEAPFGITPDTSFICTTHSHQEGLNTLMLALQGGEGFVKITGEVGCGKSLLCRRLLRALEGSDYVGAYLPNPALSPETLLRSIAAELGLELPENRHPYWLLRLLNEGLLNFAAQGKNVLLVIDEAQAIPIQTLEILRLLSNLETEKRKLMQIVLFGQPELDTTLANPAIRQLLQRIAFSYRLTGLRKDELHPYLRHRMRAAGQAGGEVFGDDAASALYKASKGTPRLVNILANKCLLAVFGEGGQMVRARHVRAAARDTEGASRRWGWWGR